MSRRAVDAGSILKKLWPTMLQSLILPSFWLVILIFDIVVFADGRAQNIFGRLFEDLVFVMSFLFYKTDGLRGSDVSYFGIVGRFALQFFFWWCMALAVLLAKNKLKEKK